MLEAPGRLLPRPMSLCLALAGRARVPDRPDRPRDAGARRSLEPGDAIHVLGPLGNGFRLDVERPLLVGGGIGIAPLPYLSAKLDRPPAVLGFRSEWHAEAAALVPNAEVVDRPGPGHRRAQGQASACPRRAGLRPGADAGSRARARPDCAARLGSADGLRLRRVLRLRGRDRRRVEAPLRGRAGVCVLLNASGCLDALTAPETARQLDAFVTKTVTPLPRGGNAPVRIAETDVGMLNSIGLANPGRDRFLAETLPRLRELGAAALGLRRRLRGARVRRDVRSARGRDDRAQSLVPERRRGARVGGRDRRRLPRRDHAPALREALAGELGHRRSSPARSPTAGADGLSLVNTIRGMKLDASCGPMLGTATGGLSGPALKPIALAAVHACLPGDRTADRGHGRGAHRTRRARALRRRRECRRARHRALLGPVRSGPDQGGVGRQNWQRSGSPRRSRRAGLRTQEALPERKHLDRRVESLRKTPANRVNRPRLTGRCKLLDSLARCRRRLRRRRRFVLSISAWKPSPGPMTSASAGRS